MMKRFFKLPLALILILLLNVNFCFAETISYDFFKQATIVVGDNMAVVNNQSVTMEQPAFIDNGRAMVPFRFLGEALGADVNWDPVTKQAKLNLPGVEVIVTVGSLNGLVNGEIIPMDVAAVNKGGRLFIPLRFVSENLGALVNYDSDAKRISVRYTDTSNWKTYEAPNEMSYKYPENWTIGPNKEDKYTVEVTSPNGSNLMTYYDNRTPGDLVSEFEKEFTDMGWTLDNTYIDDGVSFDNGYELVFSFREKDGTYSYLHVFVDKLGIGSNVGVCANSEDADGIDSYIFYQIMAS